MDNLRVIRVPRGQRTLARAYVSSACPISSVALINALRTRDGSFTSKPASAKAHNRLLSMLEFAGGAMVVDHLQNRLETASACAQTASLQGTKTHELSLKNPRRSRVGKGST